MYSDLKEFEKFLKVCRKQGITEVSFGPNTQVTHVKFGDLPMKTSSEDSSDEIPTDELSPEQLMYYAVGGTPQ